MEKNKEGKKGESVLGSKERYRRVLCKEGCTKRSGLRV